MWFFFGSVIPLAIVLSIFLPVSWVLYGSALVFGFYVGNKVETKQGMVLWSIGLSILLAFVVMIAIGNYMGDLRGISGNFANPIFEEAMDKGIRLFFLVECLYGITLLIGYGTAKQMAKEQQEHAESLTLEEIVEQIEEGLGGLEIANHPWVTNNWMAWDLGERSDFVERNQERFREMLAVGVSVADFLDEIQKIHRAEIKSQTPETSKSV